MNDLLLSKPMQGRRKVFLDGWAPIFRVFSIIIPLEKKITLLQLLTSILMMQCSGVRR